MTDTVATFSETETPTKPITNLRSPILAALAKVDRLCELAVERLLIEPDADAVLAAVEDLAAARGAIREVLR